LVVLKQLESLPMHTKNHKLAYFINGYFELSPEFLLGGFVFPSSSNNGALPISYEIQAATPINKNITKYIIYYSFGADSSNISFPLSDNGLANILNFFPVVGHTNVTPAS